MAVINTNNCRLCGTPLIDHVFSHTILNRYDVKYFRCSCCDLLQTEYPFWLPESYSNSINISDTGLVARNILQSKFVSSFLAITYGLSRLSTLKGVDLGGGYGLFVRLMRDKGFDFYWSDKYSQNLLARGFEVGGSESYDVAVCFEVLEHLNDISIDLIEMLDKANIFVFTTKLYGPSVPSARWSYYGFEHGQHINFYSHQTLIYIAKKFSLNLSSDGKSIHIFTKNKMSIPNIKFAKFLSKFHIDKLLALFLRSKMLSDHQLLRRS